MAVHAPITASSPRATPIAQILSRFDRKQLSAFITVAVDLLDVIDGDADQEEVDAEDSFALSPAAIYFTSGPGCDIADPDKAIDDDACDGSEGV